MQPPPRTVRRLTPATSRVLRSPRTRFETNAFFIAISSSVELTCLAARSASRPLLCQSTGRKACLTRLSVTASSTDSGGPSAPQRRHPDSPGCASRTGAPGSGVPGSTEPASRRSSGSSDMTERGRARVLDDPQPGTPGARGGPALSRRSAARANKSRIPVQLISRRELPSRCRCSAVWPVPRSLTVSTAWPASPQDVCHTLHSVGRLDEAGAIEGEVTRRWPRALVVHTKADHCRRSAGRHIPGEGVRVKNPGPSTGVAESATVAATTGPPLASVRRPDARRCGSEGPVSSSVSSVRTRGAAR